MTREEFEDLLGESWEEDSKAKSKYIASLEQRIVELEADNKELSKDFTHSKYVDKYTELEEPKYCDTCKWQCSPNCPVELFSQPALHYEKYPFSCNRYEPKEPL